MASVNGSSRGYTPYTKMPRPQFIINGTLAGPIPIQSSVRQGCQLSVILYALCLHPHFRTLEENLPGIKLGRSTWSPPVVASAEDVIVLLTNLEISPSSTRPCDVTKKSPEPSSTQRNGRPLPLGGGRSQKLNLELSLMN